MSNEEIVDICSMCNHNKSYHIFIREMEIIVCKVKNCKCLRSVPGIMTYSDSLLEQLK